MQSCGVLNTVHVHVYTNGNDCVDALTPCREAHCTVVLYARAVKHTACRDAHCTAVLHTRAVKHTAESRHICTRHGYVLAMATGSLCHHRLPHDDPYDDRLSCHGQPARRSDDRVSPARPSDGGAPCHAPPARPSDDRVPCGGRVPSTWW